MESSVKLLGIEIDNKLNIQNLITAVLFGTSVLKSPKIKWKIHERSLKFLSNDYLSSYAELLEKSTSVSMETKRLQFKSRSYGRYISVLTKCY